MLITKNSQARNRIKSVLVEKQLTARWLAKELGKSENTVSRWCSNKIQPSLEQLYEIANIVNVDIHSLIVDNLFESEK